MSRRFPILTLSVCLVVALLAVIRPVFADDKVPAGGPADGTKVKVEFVDGRPAVEGTITLPAISLDTDFGSTVVGWKHVRRVTFARPGGEHAKDAVQLADQSVVRGIVRGDQMRVTVNGEPTILKTAEIREMKVVRTEDLSLVTILIGLVTLAAMEIILGIDNIIFLAIVAAKLPPAQQPRARKIGLIAALGTRLLLLFSLTFLLGLTTPIFTLPELPFLHDPEAREISWRDIILLAGGLFLIGKSVYEMHDKLEHAKEAAQPGAPGPAAKAAGFAQVIVTIAVIDIVFSLDSVITAVGMVDELWVMVVAMVIAMLVMLYFAGPIATFVDRHPTIKVLALAFLILIGVMLVAEGLGQHIDKGYIYFAMAFALVIELVNMKLRGPGAKKPAGGAAPAG